MIGVLFQLVITYTTLNSQINGLVNGVQSKNNKTKQKTLKQALTSAAFHGLNKDASTLGKEPVTPLVAILSKHHGVE